MPTVSGQVEVSRVRVPGAPPAPDTFKLIVNIVGGRLSDGTTEFDPCPEDWAVFFTSIIGKRATVTYTVGPPPVISQVDVR